MERSNEIVYYIANTDNKVLYTKIAKLPLALI